MAGWISSKLKIAEGFLHQIDQQAAESLKKHEKVRSDEELGLETSKKPSEVKPLLKYQLKKKSVESNDYLNVISSNNSNYSVNNSSGSYSRDREGGVLGSTKFSSPKANQSNLTDSDWTELLSVPRKKAVSGKCSYAGCVSDLNMMCPVGLQVRSHDKRRVVACKSACFAFNSPRYCCTGSFGNPQSCKPTAYSKIFKAACPKAYSYAYDDPTSISTCTAGSYLVTFCPHR